MVEKVQERDEFIGRFFSSLRRGVIVICGVVEGIAVPYYVLNATVLITVVGIRTGQDVVEIEDHDVVPVVIILLQPVRHQPLVEGAGVGGVGGVAEGRGGDNDEEFVGLSVEVFQQLVVNVF